LLIVLLAIITFVNRVCLAADPRMQEELNITRERWGCVVAAFALSYGLFEIPTGALGDRIGTRKVLPRILTLWPGFTHLTDRSAATLRCYRFGFYSAPGRRPPPPTPWYFPMVSENEKGAGARNHVDGQPPWWRHRASLVIPV
jgi:MFS family permease